MRTRVDEGYRPPRLGGEDRPRSPRGEQTARAPDIACGCGWSSIAITDAYPLALVDGVDLDAHSTELARANAAGAGLPERVRFHLADAADPRLVGTYDLVTVVEALHDMARPVEALRAIRRLGRRRRDGARGRQRHLALLPPASLTSSSSGSRSRGVGGVSSRRPWTSRSRTVSMPMHAPCFEGRTHRSGAIARASSCRTS